MGPLREDSERADRQTARDGPLARGAEQGEGRAGRPPPASQPTAPPRRPLIGPGVPPRPAPARLPGVGATPGCPAASVLTRPGASGSLPRKRKQISRCVSAGPPGPDQSLGLASGRGRGFCFWWVEGGRRGSGSSGGGRGPRCSWRSGGGPVGWWAWPASSRKSDGGPVEWWVWPASSRKSGAQLPTVGGPGVVSSRQEFGSGGTGRRFGSGAITA